MNCVIYIRTSTKKQTEKGNGLSGQEDECKKIINSKKWNYLKTYSDKSISGNKNRTLRPGLNSLLEDAKNKKFEKILIYSLDRLGRGENLLIEIIKEITEIYKISIFSCLENVNVDKVNENVFLLIKLVENDNKLI